MVTEYLYKFTFHVKAADEDVKFNVKLKGDRTIELFPEDKELDGEEDTGDGEGYYATGDSAIVDYSSYDYNEICIEIKEGNIPDDICNKIKKITKGKKDIANIAASIEAKEEEEEETVGGRRKF